MKNVYKLISTTIFALAISLTGISQAQSLSDIQFWVGEGTDSTIVVVDFLEASPSAYAWGVKFNDSISGSDILNLISWNDKDFTVKKGQFLNDIIYKTHSGIAGTNSNYWNTWTNSIGTWVSNTGLGTYIKAGESFGFSFTGWPASAPHLIAVPVVQSFFSPQVGTVGSDAIYKDSTAITQWVTAVDGLVRGPQDIANPGGGTASFGVEQNVIGTINNQYLSLGDGGSITLSFGSYGIENGTGADFAVFENGFTFGSGAFLELAFVEVSSNGTDFVRFPSISLTPTATQTGGFGSTDAKMLHNLAGKYIKNWGTPFDLEDLKDNPNVDVNNITHIRLVDVVGSINPQFGTKDAKGHLINDPYSTPFASSGFDLDGIGIINPTLLTSTIDVTEAGFSVFPTSANDYISVISENKIESVEMIHVGTGISFSKSLDDNKSIDLNGMNTGMYIINVYQNGTWSSQKIIVE